MGSDGSFKSTWAAFKQAHKTYFYCLPVFYLNMAAVQKNLMVANQPKPLENGFS